MIAFEKIPTNFVSAILTVHQKEIAQIKYHIKLALDKWKGNRSDLYEKLAPELSLSCFWIRKLAESLPKEIDCDHLICPCCKEEFKLKPQAYWSYVDPECNIRLLKSQDIHILCSRKCSESLTNPVKGLSERRFYYIENEIS